MNTLPLFQSVCAGSPVPIDEIEKFDLASHLIQHPYDTFYVRVIGDSMIESGIYNGDLLVIDRKAEPRHSDIVVAETEDGYTVKTFTREKGHLRLIPSNASYAPVEISETTRICGVAKFAIHRL
jgi:DNA polymerase V